MRLLLLSLLLAVGIAAAQNSSPSAPAKPQKPASNSPDKSKPNPNLAPPSSDHVDASSLPDDIGDSSSKETQIDISPAPDDAKEHPQSGAVLSDEGSSTN